MKLTPLPGETEVLKLRDEVEFQCGRFEEEASPGLGKKTYGEGKAHEKARCVDPLYIYLNSIKKFRLLKAHEEKALGERIQKGDARAKRLMIESNLRLVVQAARRYYSSRMDLLDLIEEGNLGLIRAIEKFDPSKGFRLSTYATLWIRQSIERSIMSQSGAVRLPVHVIRELKLYRKKVQECSNQSGKEVHLSLVASMLNMSIEKVGRLSKLHEQSKDFNPKVEGGEGREEQYLSRTPSPYKEAEGNFLKRILVGVLDGLSERQREVVARRYGLLGYGIGTLDEVGYAVGLTRERVRQIQISALSAIQERLKSMGIQPEDILPSEFE